MGGPMIWDSGGDEISTCRHWGWNWHVPLTEGSDIFDFSLENGLTVRTIEPQVSYRVQYDAGGCQIDLTYPAARAPYYTKTETQEVSAGMINLVQAVDGEITTGHYEQHGYQFGIGSLDSAFHVFSFADRPSEEDPVIYMVDTVTSGFYVRDGVVGRVVSGTRRCVERGPGAR